MKKLLLFALLLIAPRLHAACTGSSPTWTAATAAATDVQACINLASAGDTVSVPSGTATWADGAIVVNQKINIIGATTVVVTGTPGTSGYTLTFTDNTNITLNQSSGTPVATNNTSSTSLVRFSGFTFISGTGNNQILINGTQFSPGSFRIDHSHFKNAAAHASGVMIAAVGIYGLLDHDFYDNLDTANPEHWIDFYGGNAGSDVGYAAWNQPSTLGTANCNFIEDSIVKGNTTEESIDSYIGACWVFRHSNINGGAFLSNHGTDSGNFRASRLFEGYNVNVDNSTGTQRAFMTFRGGAGVIHDITHSGSTTPSTVVAFLQIFRANNGGSACSIASQWQTCNGTAWFPSGSNLGSGNSGTINNSTPVANTSLGFCTTNKDQWGLYNSTAGNTLCNSLHSGDTMTTPFDPTGGSPGGYACRDQPGRGHNQVAQPIYTWNLDASGVAAADTCSAPYLTSGVDFVNNGTTPLPGYTPYTYPNPLQIINQQWFISSQIGGTRYDATNSPSGQCNGHGSSPYVSGVNQSCPFNDERFLWCNVTVFGDCGTWIINGGDTVNFLDVGITHPDQISGSQTGNFPDFCWGIGVSCQSPTVPSGTALQHTIFQGVNHGSCSYTDPQGLLQGDPAKQSWVWAGGGSGAAFELDSSQYVDISCINVSDHSNCNAINISCSGTDWAQKGIDTGGTVPATNGNITLTDVSIHGMQSRAIRGNIGGPWTFTRVAMFANGSAGYDLDEGSAQDSINGVINMNFVSIDWNGCAEEYPIVDTIPIQTGSCVDDVHAGYGDGIGTPPDFGITTWNIINSRFSYNTQDGADLGHLLDGTVTWKNNIFFGNMGGNMKNGNPRSLTEYNNFSLGNCFRMAAPITGVPSGFNTNLSDFCRAGGDQNTFNYDPVSLAHGLVADIEFNTFAGYGATVYDAQCFNGPCTAYTFNFSNNAIYGIADSISTPVPPYPVFSGNKPGMWNNLFPTTQAKNLFFNLNSCPANGTDISPTCVLSPAFTSMPSSPISAESQLDAFNFYPGTGPLVHAATFNASVPLDFYGITRPNPPTVGAAEPAAAPPVTGPKVFGTVKFLGTVKTF